MEVYGPTIWVSSAIPDVWTFYSAYASDATFTVPESGWYRIYCVGKCGNGGGNGWNIDHQGGGGGGAGGMAISNLLLSRSVEVPLSFSNGSAIFGSYLYATSGGNGSDYRTGGTAGNAYNGNVANLSGFAGGNGGTYSVNTGNGDAGIRGGNLGMHGGSGGSSNAASQPAGGGGGGGARLPGDGICPYVTPSSYFNNFVTSAGYGGNQTTPAVSNAHILPTISLSSNIMLYGGGGGAGGMGYFGNTMGGLPSTGTPAVVIIERGS